MLSLKQGLSLVSSNKAGSSSWTPTNESSLEAWYANKEGVSVTGVNVTSWDDSSTNSINMIQADENEQPIYNVSTGALTFDSSSKSNLQTTLQISVTEDFTLGISMKPTTTNGTFIGDNTTANELFKISSADKITVKVDSGTITLETNGGASFGDDYIVITRASDVFSLYRNGVEQTYKATLTGTIDIDAIGIRRSNVNGFSGEIKEVQIYSSSSETLISNINDRLSSL